ncbi:unnamed protein product [Choristocarpus tenellus]
MHHLSHVTGMRLAGLGPVRRSTFHGYGGSFQAFLGSLLAPRRGDASFGRQWRSPYMSLIGTDDHWGLWAGVATAAVFGQSLEKTRVGQSLSGAVCAMLVSSVMTNVGIFPADASPHLRDLQGFVVKLATPLLLLGADLSKIFLQTGSLLKAFVLAALGTTIGAVAGAALLSRPLAHVDQAWETLSAISAKNIGGGLNFVAVADVLRLAPSVVSTALAVDNILGLLYFPLVAWIGRAEGEEEGKEEDTFIQEKGGGNGSIDSKKELETDLTSSVLALGLGLAAMAEGLSRRFIPGASVPCSTLLTVVLATLFPRKLAPLVPSAMRMGRVLLFLFFSSVGATSGLVVETMRSGTAAVLFGFGVVLYLVHLGVVIGGGRVLGLSLKEVLVASNASIGNPATASAFAGSKGWRSLVTPALLVGTLGNAVGTFVGLWVGLNILRPIVGGV